LLSRLSGGSLNTRAALLEVVNEALGAAAVLPANVVVDNSCFRDGHLSALLDGLQQCLTGHFDVEHSTFQFERLGHAAHEQASHP
jgi:cobalt-zinc-cadmium efflux system protein